MNADPLGKPLLHLAQEAKAAIRQHGAGGYPLEVCGFLIGAVADSGRTVAEAWPVRNAWEDDPGQRAGLFAALARSGAEKSAAEWESAQEERRFLVSPQDQIAAMKRARAVGLDLVGIYHTHPNHPAVPSGFDRDLAWPGWSYVILSVHADEAGAGVAGDLRSWSIPDEESPFQEEEIHWITPANPVE